MKEVRIKFISAAEQKYPTLGNYGEASDHVWFEITKFDNEDYSIAVLIHEIWEFYRNKKEGISVASVDKFDLSHPELDDPGLSKEAPYHKTHMEADAVERLYIIQSGNDWVDYEAAAEKIME